MFHKNSSHLEENKIYKKKSVFWTRYFVQRFIYLLHLYNTFLKCGGPPYNFCLLSESSHGKATKQLCTGVHPGCSRSPEQFFLQIAPDTQKKSLKKFGVSGMFLGRCFGCTTWCFQVFFQYIAVILSRGFMSSRHFDIAVLAGLVVV